MTPVTSLELAKKLYERVGDSVRTRDVYTFWTDVWEVHPRDSLREWEPDLFDIEVVPAYSLDELLEVLPGWYAIYWYPIKDITLDKFIKEWAIKDIGIIDGRHIESPTPAEAAGLMVLKLYEEGILKN